MGLIRFSEFVSNLRVNSKALKAAFFARRTGIVKNVLGVLYQEGFISGFFAEDSRRLSVSLKYFNNRPVVNKVKIFTRPGHSIFYSRDQIFRDFGPFSSETFIFSTDKGIISNRVSQGLSLSRGDLTSDGDFASRFQLMPHYYFIELHGCTFYDLNFFTYRGCFDPVSDDNLRVNVKFIDFFDKNTRLFFYSFSDNNLRSFPSRFYSFLTQFVSNYNFVTFSSFSGVSSFFKFMASFLLNFSKYFSTGFLGIISKGCGVNFGNARRLMRNFFFVCFDVLDSSLFISPQVSRVISFKPRLVFSDASISGFDSDFGIGFQNFRKHFFNNIKTLAINSGEVAQGYSEALPFYSAFYAKIKSGLFSSLDSLSILRGIPDFFLRMSVGFHIVGDSLFFSQFFPVYVNLFGRTVMPFFFSARASNRSISHVGGLPLFGWCGGRNLNLLPFLFYLCRAFEDCVEILVRMGLFHRGNVNSKVNLFHEGGPLLIRVI